MRPDLLLVIPVALAAGLLAGGYVGIAVGDGIALRHELLTKPAPEPPFCKHLLRSGALHQVLVHVRIPNGTPAPKQVQVTLRNKAANWLRSNMTDDQRCATVDAPGPGIQVIDVQAQERSRTGAERHWWADALDYNAPRRGAGWLELDLDGYASFGA